MNVVSATGVAISCVAAPPSDQDTNWKVLAPDDCGDTTPSVRITPSTPRTEAGVVTGCPSSVTWRPGGAVARAIVDVRGTQVAERRVGEARGIAHRQNDAVEHVRRRLSPIGNRERPARDPARGRHEGMRVVVMVKIDLPRECARRERAVLRVAPGAGERERLPAAVQRPRGRSRDRGRRRRCSRPPSASRSCSSPSRIRW